MKRWLPIVAILGCSEAAPEVEVKAFVGDAYARHDETSKRKHALEVIRTTIGELWRPTPTHQRAPNAVAELAIAHPPATPAQLENLTSAVRRGRIDELAGPARRIAASSPNLWLPIKSALLADRAPPKGDYRSLLRAIGGDVPNRYGHFDLAWKKAHGYDVQLSSDWFEDLLALPRGRVSAMLAAVYRDCVLQTALLRAASMIAVADRTTTADVVDTLLRVAYIHHGTFRDEVGRAIERIGEPAVPYLLEHSRGASPEDERDRRDLEVMRALYAQHNLDRMERLQPARAVAAVRDDPALLAAVLGAYAQTKLGEAAAVLLEHTDDRDVAVRFTARAAFALYVTGPAPKITRRTVRLLGGGTTTARAYLTYRQRAADAISERLALIAPHLLEPACKLARVNAEDDATCERQPARLTAAYFEWLDAERSASELATLDRALANTDPEAAITALDSLLAQTATPPAPARLVAFYRSQAERLRTLDPPRAAGLLRKSAMLASGYDSGFADRLRNAALLLEAGAPTLPPAGRRMLLRTAAELAPESLAVTHAHASLVRPMHEPKPGVRLEIAGSSLAALVGLWLLGTCGGPLRRRLFR